MSTTFQTHRLLLAGLAAACVLGAAPASANGHAPAATPTPTTAPATATAEWTLAEVRRIDAETGRLQLRHEEIKSLDMPPMTMVFHTRDKALLNNLKVGDRIRFTTVKEGSRYVVTAIEPAP